MALSYKCFTVLPRVIGRAGAAAVHDTAATAAYSTGLRFQGSLSAVLQMRERMTTRRGAYTLHKALADYNCATVPDPETVEEGNAAPTCRLGAADLLTILMGVPSPHDRFGAVEVVRALQAARTMSAVAAHGEAAAKHLSARMMSTAAGGSGPGDRLAAAVATDERQVCAKK